MKSLLAFAVIASVAMTAHAQPRHRTAPPPPPPQHAPPPPPAPAPGDALAPAPAVATMTGAPMVGTPAASMESASSDQPLLQQKTEVRRAFHFEAFIDAEAGLVNKDWYPTRGFTLNDAAIYLSKDFGSGLSAMVDLPFSSIPQDLTSTTASTVAIGFGASRAQAYAQYLNGPWQAKAGQFDTMFGFERNDSRDRFFANAGLVKTSLLPYTHVGVMGGYSISQITLRAMLADPRDTGTLSNQNPELGLQARYDGVQGFYGSVGFLFGDANPKGTGTGSNQLIDVNLGAKLDRLSAGVYFDDRKTAGADKHANGFGVQGVFAATPELGLGGRIEYGSDFVFNAALAAKNAFSLSVGPSYRWLPDVTLRGDLDFASVSPYTGDNQSIFGAQASLVAGF